MHVALWTESMSILNIQAHEAFYHLILDRQEALAVIIYYLCVFYNYWVNAASLMNVCRTTSAVRSDSNTILYIRELNGLTL